MLMSGGTKKQMQHWGPRQHLIKQSPIPIWGDHLGRPSPTVGIGNGTPWQEGWKPRELKKDVKDWTSSPNKSRRIETVLARLRLGHTNITLVYLMQGQTEPPECDRCRVSITVKHLLLECRKYVTIRNKYFCNPTLSDMLAESSDFSVDKLVLYLKERKIFSIKYNSACDFDGITSYSEIYLKTSTPMFER